MKTFNSLEEIKPYYNEETDTYEFVEDGDLFDVYFEFDLKIRANIKAREIYAQDIKACDINAWDIDARDIKACDIDACDIDAQDIIAKDIEVCDINARGINARGINAQDIDAKDIKACDIKAWNINAQDISYWAVCFAQFTFKCKSIVGKRKNSKHFCLDSKIVVAE
ncbi:MAG: hypothetical protein RR576_10065 [Oscillospiraceae bacterium]